MAKDEHQEKIHGWVENYAKEHPEIKMILTQLEERKVSRRYRLGKKA